MLNAFPWHVLPPFAAAAGVFLLSSCGLPPAADLLISGGQRLEPEHPAFRSSVAITGGDSFCSGVLIGARLVLTAAHCFGDQPPEPRGIFVVMGEASLTSPVWQRAEAILVHPDYAPARRWSGNVHDLALVRLSKPFAEPFVPAAVAAPDLVLEPGEPLLATGYGVTEKEDDGILRMVSLTFHRKRWGSTEFEAKGDRLGDDVYRNTCAGDSGGPLFIFSTRGLVVAGITARGEDCRKSGQGIYTDVRDHAAWITDAAQRLTW